jgi:hypothetical protein
MRKAPPRPADKVRTAAVALVLSLGVFAASPAIVASPAFAEVSDPAAQVMGGSARWSRRCAPPSICKP